MILTIFILLLSLSIVAIFTALETALQNYNVVKIEFDKKQGLKYAEIVDRMTRERKRVTSSLRIGKLAVLLIFGISFYALTYKPLCSLFHDLNYVTILIEIFLILFIELAISEVIPIIVGSVNPNRILKLFYRVASISLKIFSPFVSKEIVMKEEPKDQDAVLIQNALGFSDVLLKKCMIPRTEVCAVEEETTYAELLDLFARTNYSRIIVYRESIDTITGYVHSKDLFRGERPVRELIRKIGYFPETTHARELLETLIKSHSTIAVVIDQFGGTAGIVTLEDLFEEIFGEIDDELDNDELVEIRQENGEFIFSGRIEVKYLNREYDLGIPESDEYETLAGFITFCNENIPVAGDVIKYENLVFTVLKTSSNRIETVSLRIVEE